MPPDIAQRTKKKKGLPSVHQLAEGKPNSDCWLHEKPGGAASSQYSKQGEAQLVPQPCRLTQEQWEPRGVTMLRKVDNIIRST